MIDGRRVALVMPALDEAGAIGGVLARVDRDLVDEVLVADNGSSDDTAGVATRAGARVVREPRRGYGSACLRALAELDGAGPETIVAFMDADGSDDPRELPHVLAPIGAGEADVVIGSRVLGDASPGALTAAQRFGNRLTCALVRWFWGVRYTDLGPFRATTLEVLRAVEMRDRDFGWTIELQVKAAQRGLRVVEVPVSRRERAAGRSKVAGNLVGSVRAGTRILRYVLEAKLVDLARGRFRR